jgi:hypothetical protein
MGRRPRAPLLPRHLRPPHESRGEGASNEPATPTLLHAERRTGGPFAGSQGSRCSRPSQQDRRRGCALRPAPGLRRSGGHGAAVGRGRHAQWRGSTRPSPPRGTCGSEARGTREIHDVHHPRERPSHRHANESSLCSNSLPASTCAWSPFQAHFPLWDKLPNGLHRQPTESSHSDAEATGRAREMMAPGSGLPGGVVSVRGDFLRQPTLTVWACMDERSLLVAFARRA